MAKRKKKRKKKGKKVLSKLTIGKKGVRRKAVRRGGGKVKPRRQRRRPGASGISAPSNPAVPPSAVVDAAGGPLGGNPTGAGLDPCKGTSAN